MGSPVKDALLRLLKSLPNTPKLPSGRWCGIESRSQTLEAAGRGSSPCSAIAVARGNSLIPHCYKMGMKITVSPQRAAVSFCVTLREMLRTRWLVTHPQPE